MAGGKRKPNNCKCLVCGIEFRRKPFYLAKGKYELLYLSEKFEEFWNIDNGVTLCIECHKITPDYGVRV